MERGLDRIEADVIEPLTRDDVEKGTTTLARAFSSDPMFTWMFPHPDRRSRSLVRFLRVPLEYGLKYGSVTRSNGAKAVAIWAPPERPMSTTGLVRTGFLAVPFQIGFGPFVKFVGANSVMEKIHKKYMPEPHWYLLIVGVDPELQGKGHGGALVAEGLERADGVNAPCYLETSEERNLAFYERQGFKVVDTAPLGKDGPPGWGMRREPAGSRT